MLAVYGALVWFDWEAIHRNEVTDDNPDALSVTNEEEWGELRKIYELKKKMDAAQVEADLIPKREQDVIVYREIVARDAGILPDFDDVNKLAKTINEFANQSGVLLSSVGDLSIKPTSEAIKMMPFKLQLSGSFDQFLKFMNLFESLDRIVNTRSFSIVVGKVIGAGRERRAIHEIQIDFETFIYSPSAGLS